MQLLHHFCISIDLKQCALLESFNVKDQYVKTVINVTIFSHVSICLQVSLPNPPSLPISLPLPLSPHVSFYCSLLSRQQQSVLITPRLYISLPAPPVCCFCYERETLGNSYSLRLDSLVFTNAWSLFPSKHSDFVKSE